MSDELVLPFYVLADVSFSMTQAKDGVSPLDGVNEVVPILKDALDENPLLSDKVRFALADFSDDFQVQIPLCDLMRVDTGSLPALSARGGTSFAAAFSGIRSQIDSDVRQMKADGKKVHRPVVFFLTDGEPTDQDGAWEREFAALTDSGFNARPNVIPFGIGDARKEVLDMLVYPTGKMRSFRAAEGVTAADAIRSMAEVLIGSVIASANSIAVGGESGGFVLEDPEESGVWI